MTYSYRIELEKQILDVFVWMRYVRLTCTRIACEGRSSLASPDLKRDAEGVVDGRVKDCSSIPLTTYKIT